MTCVLQSRDRLLVCVTGWMTAAVRLNALCKFYIRELHIVNSIKITPWIRLQSFLASKKKILACHGLRYIAIIFIRPGSRIITSTQLICPTHQLPIRQPFLLISRVIFSSTFCCPKWRLSISLLKFCKYLYAFCVVHLILIDLMTHVSAVCAEV